MTPFASIVQRSLRATPVAALLAKQPAVVLERIARGGGETRWYYCANASRMAELAGLLSPGSLVSFYFGDQIRYEALDAEVTRRVDEAIGTTREAVVGVLDRDGVRINMEVVSGPNEFAEYASAMSASSRVFYGAFPGRENDGRRAVTVTLPDADGVTREHPH